MIYTFGHSTLQSEQAAHMLTTADAPVLVDVRSHPTSKWPQWRREHLQEWVPLHRLEYIWMPELGGWDVRHADLQDEYAEYGMNIEPYTQGHFPKGRISKKLDLPEPAWTVAGFWDYMWYMTLPEFDLGIRKLLAVKRSLAYMCAEFIPWSCHRSLIADYLLHFCQTDSMHLQPKLTWHSAWKSRMDRYDPRAIALMEKNVAT